MRSTGAHFMLRRNLPLWKPAETITETIDFCEKTGIGEIVWKIDPEEFSHGFTPHSMIRDFLPWLEQARDMQERKGIIFSINPWLTLNHANRGRYFDGPPEGFHWRVLPDGGEVTERACPLNLSWLRWLLESYSLYATTKPDKLWLEDDFRTTGVQVCNNGCFCDHHLNAFSELIGARISRDELVGRITRPGEPDPIRARWFDFQGEIMVDVCRQLEKVVHQESPDTRLGLMNSWSTDGRWWSDAVQALAGPHRTLARTSLAPYDEGRAVNLLPDESDMLKEIVCLPDGVENCPELDNCSYTPYVKSARMTRLQIILSQVLGFRAITMNLFDMVGGATAEDPRIGTMLSELKPIADGIAGVAGPGGRPRGVSVPFSKCYADAVHVEPNQGFEAFRFDGEGWCMPLQGSGMPIVLNGDGNVSALSGQSARALSRDKIEHLLHHGLLLDGSAAAVLSELGYGTRIGVEPGEMIDRENMLLSAERDDWSESRTSKDPAYMTLRHIARPRVGRLRPLSLMPGARTTSVFVDPDHEVIMPGMVVFENGWGGRVATYPFDLSVRIEVGFMNWHRRRQLQRIVGWLGRDQVDLFVDGGAWMMPVRRDYPDYTLVSVLNVETDPWDDIVLVFEHSADPNKLRVELLDDQGAFREIHSDLLESDSRNIRLHLPVPVPALDFVALRIS